MLHPSKKAFLLCLEACQTFCWPPNSTQIATMQRFAMCCQASVSTSQSLSLQDLSDMLQKLNMLRSQLSLNISFRSCVSRLENSIRVNKQLLDESFQIWTIFQNLSKSCNFNQLSPFPYQTLCFIYCQWHMNRTSIGCNDQLSLLSVKAPRTAYLSRTPRTLSVEKILCRVEKF